MKDFTKRWKDKTECSEGYKTTDCKNGPKATPTPSAAAGTCQRRPDRAGTGAGVDRPPRRRLISSSPSLTKRRLRAALRFNLGRMESAADAVARLTS